MAVSAPASEQRVRQGEGEEQQRQHRPEEVKGLDPDTAYKYRFCTRQGGHVRHRQVHHRAGPELQGDDPLRRSPAIRTRGPCPAGTTPYWNNFEIWDAIRQKRNDFNVLMGDTIYSDTEVPGYTLADVALTMQQKWHAYKINLAMKPWAKAAARPPTTPTGTTTSSSTTSPSARTPSRSASATVNIDGEKLYKRGVEAFTDYNPVTYSKQTGIYRSVRWGKNLEVFFLDERSFRSQRSDYQGVCDNPPGSGDPDLAPTAPQSTRNIFAADRAAARQPGAPGCLASINDPSRTMLGSKQLEKFKKEIANSKATFKVILNEVPIQQYYAMPYDRWEGYAAERRSAPALPPGQRQERRLPDRRRARQPGQRRPLLHARRWRRRRTPGSSTSPPARSRPRPTRLEISDTVGNPSAAP